MKKMMLMAAMLAMVLAIAVPAIAQVGNGAGQESESGGAAISNAVENAGDSSSLCPATQQFTNTGNLQNAQGFAQYATTTDDVEFGGAAFEFGPEFEYACTTTIEQAAAAG